MHGIPKGTEKTKSFGMYGIRQSRENETVNGMWDIYFPLWFTYMVYGDEHQ